jgi:hypothetical protein
LHSYGNLATRQGCQHVYKEKLAEFESMYDKVKSERLEQRKEQRREQRRIPWFKGLKFKFYVLNP